MPTERFEQFSFASGEFDPLLWGRSDTTMFFNSARRLENVVALPQGGLKRREGWKFKAKQRGPIGLLDISAATLTAVNGGTAANARDGDVTTVVLTTGAINAATAYEVLRVQFASAEAISLVDLLSVNFVNLPVGVTEGTIGLQSSDDGAAWVTRASMLAGDISYRRRLATEPDTLLGTAVFWRVLVLNPDAVDFSTAEVSLGEIRFWQEDGYSAVAGEIGNFSMHRITANADDEYCIALTDSNADIFRFDTGEWVAACDAPYTDADVSRVKNNPYIDTIILYHKNYNPFQIQRLSGDANWRFNSIAFTSVADFAFTTGTVSGGVNEVQRYAFSNMSAADTLVVEFNGEISTVITWTNNEATNATALEAAIEGLADFTAVTVTADGAGVNAAMEVEFAGNWSEMPVPTLIINFLTGTGTAVMERLVYGKADTAPLWGGSRGFPTCGTFYQGRHYMGGFRNRPDVLAASRAGSPFDFKEDAEPVAGSPFVVAITSDDEITIHNVFPGRHLQIFTSSGEFYVPDEPITVDNIAVKSTSRYGSSELTQPVDVQGGTLFVDRNGRAIRENLFTDAQASYTAEPISILARHLVANPRSLVLRRARDVDEPAMLLVANNGRDANGALIPPALCVIDRVQQITGFERIVTQGGVLGFSTSQGGDAFAMARRSLAGKAWNYLELFDRTCMSDCSVKIANPDIDEFVATAGQTVFTWTFSNPAETSDIGVWRLVGTVWDQSAPSTFTLNTGAKTVTFDTGQDEDQEVRIVKRALVVDVSDVPWFEDVEVAAHSDGLPLGDFTVSGGEIDLGDQRYDFECEVGLKQVPRVVMHPFKTKGGPPATMHRMRIFDCLLQMERTGDVAIGMEGDRAKQVALQRYETGAMDPSLEEVLFTGTKRISGIGRWLLEPCLEITQVDPMPFTLRSVTYDVRL